MTQACQVPGLRGCQPVGRDVHALDSQFHGFEDEILHGHLLLLEVRAIGVGTTSRQEPWSGRDGRVERKRRPGGSPSQGCDGACAGSLDELPAANVLSHMASRESKDSDVLAAGSCSDRIPGGAAGNSVDITRATRGGLSVHARWAGWDSPARGTEHGASDGRRKGDDRCLPRARRRSSFRLDADRLDAGTSRKRGTRYCESAAFVIRPSSNAIASNSAPPMPCTTAPSTWFFRPPGFTTAPHSNAETMR